MTPADASTLLIIPARGGSKGIPRKNLRLLGGRPLITHVILTASTIADCHLVVSTDDEEIAEVARLSDTEVIMRPAELAGDEATLDQAVAHACEQAEALHRIRYDKVVTLQPTSPFTTAETVLRAIEMLGQADSVISVSDARHLRWTEQDDQPVPLYEKRVNRQWLPPTWSETGGVIACRRDMLDTGTRIAGSIALLKVDARESLDIDTHRDWAVAESLIDTPRIAIRLIGDSAHGLGHVFRGLTLADSMYSKPLFIAHSSSSMASRIIRSRHYQCIEHQDSAELIDILKAQRIEVLINDVLDTEAEQMQSIRDACGCLLVNFEDLGSGSDVADITFNALYEHDSPAANQRHGWRWFCLREEFLHAFDQGVSEAGHTNVLVAFGGTDPRGLTGRVIRGIASLEDLCGDIELCVVVGPGNPNLEKIEALLSTHSDRFASIRVLHKVARMSDLMRAADFAITSNGRTVFELAACSTPMIVICQNERETTHSFTRECGAAIDLGYSEEFPQQGFIEAFRAMISDPDMRQEMTAALQDFDLQAGTRRVLDEISALYRSRRLEE